MAKLILAKTFGNSLSDLPNGFVGEYSTSGTPINASLITGLPYTSGLAISGNNLFEVNYYGGTVGEYTTLGATVNADLISGLNSPWSIAVEATPEPSTWALMALGLGCGLFLRHRRFASKQS